MLWLAPHGLSRVQAFSIDPAASSGGPGAIFEELLAFVAAQLRRPGVAVPAGHRRWSSEADGLLPHAISTVHLFRPGARQQPRAVIDIVFEAADGS